jgi:5-methylcytosine-specific restriction endonuclease McrA
MDPFYFEIDEREIKKQRSKARDLRKSQWWIRKCDKGLCHYCNQPIPPKDLTMDHLVPVIRGGKSTKGNLVTSCKDCNTKKKQMMPIEWDEYMRSNLE